MMAFNLDSIRARKSAFSARKQECGFVGALKSEEGAIDLASIMVGVIVIGVIAGTIAATVFAVIPWSQDKAAKQSLDSVNQAESVAFAQSTDKGAGKYLDSATITTVDGAGQAPGLLQASKSVLIKSNGTGYIAVSKSPTGKFFATTDKNPNTPAEYATLAALNAAFPATLTDSTGTTTTGNTNDDHYKAADFS
jgi:type II secretory pathway pseudopilin PulG